MTRLHLIIAALIAVIALTLIVSLPSIADGSFFTGLMPWIVAGMVAGAFVLSKASSLQSMNRISHGSARPASRRDALPFMHQQRSLLSVFLPQVAPQLPAPSESYLVLGTYQRQSIALDEKQQEEHLLLIAQTGGGKSSLVIIPGLLRERGSRSLFVADMKDELYRKTAGAVAQHHIVWLFAPMRPQVSRGYNPLAHIHSVEDAQDFATCWTRNTGSGGEAYWNNNVRLIITAMVLHMHTTEPDAPLSRLADLLTGTDFDSLSALLTNSPSMEARREIGQFLNNMKLNERAAGATMTDVANRFQALSGASVRQATAINEIDFARMADDDARIALYLSLDPDDAERLRPLISCMTMQMFQAWRRKAKEHISGALSHGIACYLDEFANIGYIPRYASYISTARSLRVALLMACQSFAQLEEIYGRQDAVTIRTNAVTQLLLPGAGLEECRYFSERAGDTTVVATSSRSTERESQQTESESGRRLYTPDELRTMPERSIFMIRGRVPAMMLRATPYYEDDGLAQLAALYAPMHQSNATRTIPYAWQSAPAAEPEPEPLRWPLPLVREELAATAIEPQIVLGELPEPASQPTPSTDADANDIILPE
jgi:type IV secretion system protein VirD4